MEFPKAFDLLHLAVTEELLLRMRWPPGLFAVFAAAFLVAPAMFKVILWAFGS